MAKDQQLSKLVDFARVWWNDARNYRVEKRSDANMKELTESMVTGWLANSDPVITMKVGCLDFDETEVQAAVVYRQKTLEALTAGVATDSSLRFKLTAFKLLYCDGHGKIRAPEYAANSCFGRQSVYLDSVAKFLALQDKQSKMSDDDMKVEMFNNPSVPDVRKMSVVTVVPCVQYDFASEDERLEKQVEENERKLVGNLPPNDLDTLRAAYRLFRNHLRPESYFRTKFKPGRGIKYYAICFLDLRFPELRVMERILSDPGTDGHISLKAINFRIVQQFKVRVLAQEGLGGKAAKNQQPIEVHEIARYFGSPTRPPTPGKMLAGEVWKSLAEAETNLIVRKIAAGNIQANQDFIVNTLRPNSDVFNLTLNLIDEGKGSVVKDVLMAIRDGKDVLGAVKEATDLKVKVDELSTKITGLEADLTGTANALSIANSNTAEEYRKLAEANAKITDLESKLSKATSGNKKPQSQPQKTQA